MNAQEKQRLEKTEPIQHEHVDSCGSCRYYKEFFEEEEDEDEEDDGDMETGFCCRYPPQIFPGITPLALHPDVSRKHWCGEYMPK